MSDDQTPSENPEVPRATASKLSAAFASMMQPGGSQGAETSDESLAVGSDKQAASPRGIVEAILFVGVEGDGPFGNPIPAEQIASAMRDVSVEEVIELVAELNAIYQEDEAPYRIEEQQGAYRMVLRDEFADVMTQLKGETKSARLSPAMLEVLSIVAYRQPIGQVEIDELRGERSSSAMRQLERRGIVLRIDSKDEEGPTFKTSERFLEMMSLESLDQLPRIAEHND